LKNLKLEKGVSYLDTYNAYRVIGSDSLSFLSIILDLFCAPSGFFVA